MGLQDVTINSVSALSAMLAACSGRLPPRLELLGPAATFPVGLDGLRVVEVIHDQNPATAEVTLMRVDLPAPLIVMVESPSVSVHDPIVR